MVLQIAIVGFVLITLFAILQLTTLKNASASQIGFSVALFLIPLMMLGYMLFQKKKAKELGFTYGIVEASSVKKQQEEEYKRKKEEFSRQAKQPKAE